MNITNLTDQQQCAVCGGVLQDGTITYTQVIGESVAIVKEVPAVICQQCGEEYLSSHTVTAIQQAITEGTGQTKTEVPVYRFPAL